MKDKIWYDMVHCKFGCIYLAHYLDRSKFRRKWFKIITLIFSTAGVFGWKAWEYFPVVACVLISIMQIINLVENHIVPTEQSIEKISELRMLYVERFNLLERLWTDFRSDLLNEQNATENFYNLRKFGERIEEIDNKLDLPDVKALRDISHIEATTYFNEYHSKD